MRAVCRAFVRRTRAKGEINGKSANLNNALKNIIYQEYTANPAQIPVGELVVVFDADMQVWHSRLLAVIANGLMQLECLLSISDVLAALTICLLSHLLSKCSTCTSLGGLAQSADTVSACWKICANCLWTYGCR
jgi:hypothetical protein